MPLEAAEPPLHVDDEAEIPEPVVEAEVENEEEGTARVEEPESS